MTPPTIAHWIDGRRHGGLGERRQPVTNPATGAVSAHVVLADRAEVDAAVQALIPHLQPGDLVFFCGANDEKRERITHVGMYLGGGEFIHSAGQSVGVTVSPLFSGYYWDVFWGARRMLPPCQ